ncbi:hypothetical protein [Dyadobacter fermentans]|uniref:Transcriptional regulator n=1 Tax=Dyadobacter fermentans (strain ATCC 700827 / DSM 18053 / CIP 107007 / KCTC 52180 / NS114) TaxID=471854 RepID=C6W0H4_DYAFD|nr:hypothetical protein [Dyadobacter fermentans]ACT93580.1 conserved hypothetical protein [Dyadobacter fermentans DSM 18053]
MERSISKYLTKILKDNGVKVWHVGTYLALVLIWDRNRKSSPFQVTRKLIMQLAMTRSSATYHKYLKELEVLGYIHYQPSFHPKQGSKVWLLD